MSGFVTRDVARVEGRLTPFRWSWAEREGAAIDAYFARAKARQPRLFDGRVLLAHRWEIAGDTLRTHWFETRFSRLLCWKETGRPGGEVFNGFAMAALRAADGAYLLGEMSAHTANAGHIYFPAGTPDFEDVTGEVVDLSGSVLRELREETGVTPDMVEVAPRWSATIGEGIIACFRPMRMRLDAGAAVDFIHAALDRQQDRELARMHVARGPADLDPARTPAYLRAYFASLWPNRNQPG